MVTTNGINIGSLYVIDPRPNLSLTESQKEALGTIADAVMDYMETSRQSLEANRLAKVLSGLNSFVQAEVKPDTSKMPAYQSADLSGQESSHIHQTLEGEKEHFSIKDTNKGPPVRSTSQTNSAEDSDDLSTDATPSPPFLDRETRSQKVPTLPSNHTSSRIHRTFQHAANSIRQSLDLGTNGGVVIFGTNARAEPDSHNGLGQDPDPKSRIANIWAISDTQSHGENGGVSHSHPAAQMDLQFARRILRRYRRGGLWHFHQDGTAFSSDEDEVTTGEQDVVGLSPPPLSVHPHSFGALREKDLQALKKYFPDAKRIMFVPLWDSFNSRWFGGCFSWSCLETRVFSAHLELGGFFGFGSSLMVEYSRIQSQESDKKKDDFISTISYVTLPHFSSLLYLHSTLGISDDNCYDRHELRSPLHGILAANEFLAEYVESEFARRLLDTISACGQTLLDTFEQILDFAKINSFESKRQRSSSSSPSLRSRQKTGSGNVSQQPLRLLKLVDIVAVIEDVIESVYSGQILSGAMTSGNNASGRWSLDTTGDHNGAAKVTKLERIDVFVDAAPRNWEFVLEPGALRRVVMNVFGNALKYTEVGTVSVRLEILKADVNPSSNPSEGVGSPELLLIVSDTGKGISSQYLQSDIFTPFSQEDVLSPGTGLGLSLVRKILRPLNGNISIESQLGVGTTVKMTFPLTQPQQHKILEPSSSISDSSHEATNLIKQVRTGLEGKLLRFITAQDPAFVTPSNLMITKYLTEWFGMKIWTGDSIAPIDFLVVNERELDLVVNTQHESLIIVLCHRSPRTWSTITGANKLPSNAICLTLPCGPHQLARTLLGSINCMTPNQPLGLAEPSPLGFTENLSEINLLLKHHSLSNTEVTGPTSVPDTSHFEVAPNRGPLVTHDRDVPKSNPRLNSTTTEHGSVVEGVISDPHVSLTTDATSGTRILLVEDNAINLGLLEKYLARTKPHTLHTAINGQKAVDSVQAMSLGYHYIFMGKLIYSYFLFHDPTHC